MKKHLNMATGGGGQQRPPTKKMPANPVMPAKKKK